MKIEFFKQRKIKDNNENRKYIKHTEQKGKDFYEDELIEEIRLEKLNLTKLKEKLNFNVSPIITFLFSILSVFGSWIIIYVNISNSLFNYADFINNNNKENINAEVLKSQSESLKEIFTNNIDLVLRIISFGFSVIVFCFIVFMIDWIRKSDIVEKISKTELRIEIYSDILNNKKYKSDNQVISKDDSEEETELNKKRKFISVYKKKFDLFLSQYRDLNFADDELEKEKCAINTEIERIKHYRTEYKKKDYFEKGMTGIAIVLAFYSLMTSAINLDQYEIVTNIIVIIAGIATLYVLFQIRKNSKKEEVVKKNIDNIINEEKDLFIDLNIKIQVISYLLNSNKTISELVSSKGIMREVAIEEIKE